jgi:hypothetical protein
MISAANRAKQVVGGLGSYYLRFDTSSSGILGQKIINFSPANQRTLFAACRRS